MHPNIAGALLNSALYLTCVFAAGLVTGHPAAWKLAIVTMGIAFFSHVAQLIPDNKLFAYTAAGLVIASWGLGAAAGISLLF